MLIDKEKIQKAKEKLGDRNADIIAELLNIDKWDEKNKRGCCPFHSEDTPSFIFNPKTLKFHCFGCAVNTDILDAYIHTGKTYMEAVQALFEEAGVKYSFSELGIKTKREYRYPHEEPINDKSRVYAYLGKRGISREVIDAADVREDANGNCVFNFYDTNGVLTLVKYRPSRKIDKSKGEIKCWCQKDSDTAPLLFRMDKVNPAEPLVITEGEIDCLAVMEAGWRNVVSCPLGSQNMHWIEENFEWLEQFESIIICSDNDEAGIKMRKDAIARLGTWRCKYVQIPELYTDEEGKPHRMKDANEVLYYMGGQALYNLILNADDPGVPSVTNISEIGDIDIDDIDGVETGIYELDKEIMRLFNGTLTVISGTPGAGKTSFLSQLVCQSLDQGIVPMMFSREMPGFLQKSWIQSVMAGPANVREYENRQGGRYYKVTPEAKSAIDKFYDKKWFLYRDDYSNKFDDVIVAMTDCLRKYGARLIILDNLMCLDMSSDAESELQKQTEAITRLIEFAMRYQAAVILVAHPRKLAAGTEVGIYDVAGSSNIANLAHRTFGLRRIDQEKEQSSYSVALTIIKDRLLGKSNKKINMHYDPPSRRFYTNPAEYNHQYAWESHIRRDPLPYPHTEENEIYGDPI